jgi:chemotaxis protein methyltransferase CheR
MTPELFRKFSAIAYDKAGIALKNGKETLVATRVRKRQRALGIPFAEDYLKYLEADRNGEEMIHFLDAISTNYTSFFRERDHFQVIATAVGEWISQGRNRLRIWSAAASSGEEPYSIAIAALQAIDARPAELKILATDISTHVLRKAQLGIYDIGHLQALTERQRGTFFVPLDQPNSSGQQMQVNQQVRDLVTFKRLNLSKPPFPMKGPFDLILCRNVMIYFDTSVRERLVKEIERLIKPDGYFMTGHTETLMGIDTNFRAVTPSVYRLYSGRLSLSPRRVSKKPSAHPQSLKPHGKIQ